MIYDGDCFPTERPPEVETRFCVAWKTELPHGSVQRSPPFSFESMEWHLQLTEVVQERPQNNLHRLTLHVDAPGGRLDRPFRITTLLERGSADKMPRICSVKTVNSTGQVLSIVGRDILHPALSIHDISIVCLLQHDPNASSIPQSSSKKIDLLTQDDSESSASVDIPPDLESLSHDLCNLLEREDFPDVKLKCGSRTIPAHRAVLAARSEVFAAMFRNKMAESETGVVDVTDVDVQVFELFLKYVYSGKMQCLPEGLVPGLYASADKYAVRALKRECSRQMIAGLTEDNCVHLLTVADAHSDVAFKEEVISFICGHEAVFQSEDWLGFSDRPSKLAIEVYQCFVRLKSKIGQETSPLSGD